LWLELGLSPHVVVEIFQFFPIVVQV